MRKLEHAIGPSVRNRELHLGAQLYVSLAGETVIDAGLGEARAGVRMRPDHLMLWMSSTKPVTAIAIGQLWEKGLVALDDKVVRYIPEFGAGNKDPITIRHILTHTGGFPKAVGPWSYDPWEKIIAQICASPLEPGWVPGRDCGYHVASGWYILGEIVRRLDGRAYSRYVREEILEPLEMRDSWLGMPPEQHAAYGDRVVPMHLADGNAPPIPQPYEFFGESAKAAAICRPGGNSRGPMRELGRFYEALLDGGRGIIRPQTIEALTSRHTVALRDRIFGVALDRGLGFVIDSKRNGPGAGWYGNHCSPRTFGHSGYVSSTAFADPEHRLVVAIVYNGMLETAPLKHASRITATLDAIYKDLIPASASPDA